MRLEHSEGKQLEEYLSHASWDASAAGTLVAVHSGSQDAAAKAIKTFEVCKFVKLRLLRQARTIYKSETASSW